MLLLYGVCECCNLVSTMKLKTKGTKELKMTKIKKKKADTNELHMNTLRHYLDHY
nr:hypothetical protein [Tanacetum cinerariifolium]